jgi:hypothetical protein
VPRNPRRNQDGFPEERPSRSKIFAYPRQNGTRAGKMCRKILVEFVGSSDAESDEELQT